MILKEKILTASIIFYCFLAISILILAIDGSITILDFFLAELFVIMILLFFEIYLVALDNIGVPTLEKHDFSMLPKVEKPKPEPIKIVPTSYNQIIEALKERGVFLDGCPLYNAWTNKDGSLGAYIDGDIIIKNQGGKQ